jgi:hypothetical protein
MNEEFLKFLKDIRSNNKIISFDESATKQGVILRILSFLGWNIFNIEEVYPEYSVGEKKVDYALRYNNSNKVFIEVKKIGEELDKHQEQLLNYAFQEGVKLAVLTNGITWWFYLPLHEGSWEQRKFYTIEIYDQEPDEILQKFMDFLSKENVITGKAVDNAENIYKSKQRELIIKETLPRAWNRIIEEFDELFLELIAEKTEKLCGYKPDYQTIQLFIESNINKLIFSEVKHKIDMNLENKNSIGLEDTYTNKSIISFTFRGVRYKINSYREMLLKICEIMFINHRDIFENKVLSLRGRKRPYFTKKPNELRYPAKIRGTNIYVEVNLSANSIVKFSIDIISIFGYTKSDLFIETL